MLELAKNSSNVTAIVKTLSGTFGNLAMTIGSVSSLMKTWNDDNISFGDKLLQTVTVASMAIPMVINGWKQLSEASEQLGKGIFSVTKLIENQTVANYAHIVSTERMAAVKLLEKSTQKGVIASLVQESAAKQEDIIASGADKIANDALNLAKEQGKHISDNEAEAIKRLAKVKYAEAAASAAEAAETGTLTVAKLALKSAIDKVNLAIQANPLGVLLIALTAVTAAVTAFIQAQKEAREEQKKQNEEIINHANKLREESKANEELLEKMKALHKEYIESGSSREELNTTVEELCKNYDIEINKLELLSGQYDNIIKKINEKREAQLKDIQISGRDSVDAAFQELQIEGSANYATGNENMAGFDFQSKYGNIRGKGEASHNYYVRCVRGNELPEFTSSTSSINGNVIVTNICLDEAKTR